jgi:hypothetical protein
VAAAWLLEFLFDRRPETEPLAALSCSEVRAFLLRLDLRLDEAEVDPEGSCIVCGGGAESDGLDMVGKVFPFLVRGKVSRGVESGAGSGTLCRFDRRVVGADCCSARSLCCGVVASWTRAFLFLDGRGDLSKDSSAPGVADAADTPLGARPEDGSSGRAAWLAAWRAEDLVRLGEEGAAWDSPGPQFWLRLLLLS